MASTINKGLLLILLLPFIHVHAQDTARILRKDAFMDILKSYHPVLKQAALSIDIAQSKIMQARGAFDPSANANLDIKTFESKEYYSYRDAHISIPTWYGLEIKTGVGDVAGERVTAEATLGTTVYAGIKIAANELIFDKRRAALRQATAYRQMSEAERQLTINDLFYEGLTAYWDWLRDYRLYHVITRAVQNNEQRLRLIRMEYEQGARPAIDTTEALAQLQTFYLQQSDAMLKLNNAGLKLSNFLWLENNQPFLWDNKILPDTSLNDQPKGLPALTQLIDTTAIHPKLRMLETKMDILTTENLLVRQSLIPKLSASGNILSRNFDSPVAANSAFVSDNHKISVDISIPLLQRYARGKYRETKLQLLKTMFEQSNTQLQLENKVRMYYNEALTLQNQVAMYVSAVNNFKILLGGEQTRFELGESSLFILNSRENKWLEANQKLIELEMKYLQKKAAILWAAGILK